MSLTASPSAIARGESTQLSWSSTGVARCLAYGAWSGYQEPSGVVTVSPTWTSTYGLSCWGPGWVSGQTTVSVVEAPPPTVSLAASPSAIEHGAPATLSWSSTDASSCVASGSWSGEKATSGSATVWPATSTTYTLSCSGPGGSGSDVASVTVTAPLSFSELYEAERAVILPPMTTGGDVHALGGAYVVPASGTTSTSPSREAVLEFSVPSSSTYYLWARLFGPSGSGDALYVGIDDSWDRVFPSSHGAYEWVAVASGTGGREFALASGTHVFQIGHGEIGARIDALYLTNDPEDVPTFAPDAPAEPAPTVSVTASPTSIEQGDAATLSWSSTDADACTASGDWSGSKPTTGTENRSPTTSATYTLTCTGPGGSASASASVAVTAAPAPTVSLTASPSSIEEGQSATLEWSSSDADSCEASVGWSGSRPTSGSALVSPEADAIYTLTCAGNGGTVSDSVSVTVSAASSGGGSSGSSGGDDLATGGWGSDTVGGDDRPVCTVTSLADSGAGSLRSCLSGGRVRVDFAVEGTISCASALDVEAYTTIDGTTAPGHGITVEGCQVTIAGSDAHDIRLRGFRIRGSAGDNLQIQEGAHHVHVERMSFAHCGDGNVDITRGAHHVTIEHSILAGCSKNLLIADTVESHGDLHSIAIHRNVLVNSQWRNPWVSANRDGGTGPGTSVHFEGNVVWGWGNDGGGVGSECGSVVNVEKNLFACDDSGTCSAGRQRKHVIVKSRSTCSDPRVHTSGNHSADPSGGDPDEEGNAGSENPRPVPDVPPVSDWCTAAHDAVANAGVRPLDSVDHDHLATITLPACS